jgi:hypothetical protein
MPAADRPVENPTAKKKSAEKALIPLPPTGSTSKFNEKFGVMKTIDLARRAAGFERFERVSFCERL